MATPFYGSRKLALELGVNRKRIQRLMRMMGLEAIYPKRRTTWPGAGHKIYPYLLRNVEITRPNQVWSSDITYLPMRHGFLYLTAVIDWHSRYVLAWRLSNTMDGSFCVEALESALRNCQPEIFNTDQGSQFTSSAYTERLHSCGIAISMDGRGRALDNVFIERLWRSVKYEEVYLRDYGDGREAEASLTRVLRVLLPPSNPSGRSTTARRPKSTNRTQADVARRRQQRKSARNKCINVQRNGTRGS